MHLCVCFILILKVAKLFTFCKILAEPCSAWSLIHDDKSTAKKCSKHPSGTICTVECRPGYGFVESTLFTNYTNRLNAQPRQQSEQKFNCLLDGRWSPSNTPLACVPVCKLNFFYSICCIMIFVY